MLALYHGANSVCSIKVRLVLAEKKLDWESRHIDLPAGEQFKPEFLKINPRAIVPVLDHDGQLIYESSVIAEYLDGLSPHNPLMPDDPLMRARTRIWGIYTLDYHDSVNTLTFASYQREMLLDKPAEELAARWQAMPNKIRARKVQELVQLGNDSLYIGVAFKILAQMCAEAEQALAAGPWLSGDRYCLADALLTPYFFRIDCIGLSSLWTSHYPRVTDWYDRVRQRPSFAMATAEWLDEAQIAKITEIGQRVFLADDRFAEYL